MTADGAILLVDDDESWAVLVRHMLRKTTLGLPCEWCGDFDAALSRLESAAHTCALVDHYLGQQTGIDLLLARSAHARQVPVILLSGADDAATSERAYAAGAVAVLSKDGLTPALLEAAVRMALRVASGQA